jgi:pimeloyl-ACP methyl ester carboxylesterase
LSPTAPEPFEPRFEDGVVEEMRARLRGARWPEAAEPRAEDGWGWGADIDTVRRVCEWWGEEYDPRGLLERLGELECRRWNGLCVHLGRGEEEARGGAVPILLIHGWPGSPLEFRRMVPLLLAEGHDVVVPTLPGFGFSEAAVPPESAVAVADRLAELMAALGYERYLVQGGDWGSHIGAALAHRHGGHVVGLHLNTPGVLPLAGGLAEGQLDLGEEEVAYLAGAQRWRLREGNHLIVHAAVPDALGIGLHDSPAALAAWLLPRYRDWSDCDGDLLGHFEMRDLCDLLTFYWATGTATSALRLYAASARDRFKLGPGETIAVPAAVADFPAEIVRPPRAWTERVLSDLRRCTEMPSGGHFAAWEEPELLARDVLAFAAEL